MKFKGIIFDLDGTLVYSLDAHLKSWVAAFLEFNLDTESDKIKQQFGKTSHDIIKSLFPDIDDDLILKISKRRNHIFQTKFVYEVKPFDSVISLLSTLENFKLAIATSNNRKNLEKILEVTKINKYISTLVSKEDIEYGKPHPQIFEIAAKKLDLNSKECVGVGDTVYDIISANKAGMFSVAVALGEQSVDKLKTANPDFVIDHISDFKKILNIENTY